MEGGTWEIRSFRGLVVLTISTNLCNVHKLGLETSKGEAGDGLCSAVMRSSAASIAASTEDVRSMEKLCEKKATVSESCCDLVAGM